MNATVGFAAYAADPPLYAADPPLYAASPIRPDETTASTLRILAARLQDALLFKTAVLSTAASLSLWV